MRVDDSMNARVAGNPRLVNVSVGVDDRAHTWFVRRRYLSDFAPKLFR
jgi:hypothetical protein